MNGVDLQTERLRIRRFTQGDLESCAAFHKEVFHSTASRAAVAAWLQWTIDSYRELARLSQLPYADYALISRDDGRFIGAAGIVPTVIAWGALDGDNDDQTLSPEVGLFWGVMPQHRRRGYAAEAGRALLEYLFGALQIRQVVATTESDNIASQGVMTKLGMTLLRNPLSEPRWMQVVGRIAHPRFRI